MRIPFRVKLAFAIATIAVGITSGSIYYFYSTTAELVRSQLRERLKNIVHMGVQMFDENDRVILKRLVTTAQSKARPARPLVKDIEEGNSIPSIPSAESQQIMAGADYQHLIKIMRRLNQGSLIQVTPFQANPVGQYIGEADAPLVFANIFVPVPEVNDRPVIKFLIDTMFAPDNPDRSNPIGNLYVPYSYGVTFTKVFQGALQVDQDFYTDQFGTLMAASAPIYDQNGKIIAALGVDIDVTSQANRLNQLAWLAGSLISTSILLSILLAMVVARGLSRPIAQLQTVAETVQKRDFNTSLVLRSNDEWEVLANAFNAMIGEIRTYATSLEDQVAARTAELTQANAEIIGLNEQLRGENLRMGAELAILRQMQQMILPKSEELRIEGVDIAGFMEPADEVGGDYYDVLETDGVITIGIGDVTGHGLESGLLMLMTQTAVRLLKEMREIDPVRFLEYLNRTIYKNVQRMNSDKNLSLSILNYQAGRGSLSGQHEEAILVRKNGEIERIDTANLGFPVGLTDTIADFVSHTTFTLDEGDGVVLYTDGIPEAENSLKKHYGIDRLCAVLAQNWHLSAENIRNAVIVDVKRHIGSNKVYDDITLVILKQSSPPPLNWQELAQPNSEEFAEPVLAV